MKIFKYNLKNLIIKLILNYKLKSNKKNLLNMNYNKRTGEYEANKNLS